MSTPSCRLEVVGDHMWAAVQGMRALVIEWSPSPHAGLDQRKPSANLAASEGYTLSEHMDEASPYDKSLTPVTRLGIILFIAVAGLFYAKWMPYYNKAFLAFGNHSIGKSILMGTASQPPAPSWRSAREVTGACAPPFYFLRRDFGPLREGARSSPRSILLRIWISS